MRREECSCKAVEASLELFLILMAKGCSGIVNMYPRTKSGNRCLLLRSFWMFVVVRGCHARSIFEKVSGSCVWFSLL